MKWRGLAIFIVILPFLLNQTTIVDPLLQKPWIPDSEEEEKTSFYRFLSLSKEKIESRKLKDAFGRNYLFSPSGSIRFLLDDEYRKEFPLLSQADIATKELKALYEKRKEKEAIFLGKGIQLCHRIKMAKEPGFYPSWLIETNQITNKATNEWSDDIIPLDLVSDPYGCYVGDKTNIGDLVLESESFRYQITIPNALRFEGLFGDRIGVYGETTDSNYRIVRFVEFLKDSMPEGMDDFLEAYLLMEGGKTKRRSPKIILSIGTSFDQKVQLRTTQNYFYFWDDIRGINKSKKRTGYTRKELGDSYLSEWTEIDEVGVKKKFEMLEYYFYKAPRGYLISLYYPESEKSKAEQYWKGIRKSIKIQD